MNKKLIIGLLLTLALVVSGFTYAYWASGVTVTNTPDGSGNISIGSGDPVTTTIAVGTVGVAGSSLVPTDYVDGDTDTAVLTIPVTWILEAGADGALGTLVASGAVLSHATLSEAQLNAMFTVTYTTNSVEIENGGSAVDVVMTVVFANEPASKAIYDLLQANALITLTVTLTVTPTA